MVRHFVPCRLFVAMLAIAGGSLGLLAVGGCQKAAATAAAPGKPPPPEVFFTTPVSRDVQEYEEFTGRTWAVSSVEVRARVSGYLNKVLFQDGATVSENDLLFEIDSRTYDAELAKAAATVEQAKARVARLEKQKNRAEELFARKVMSEEDYDQRTFDLTEAQAAVEVAEAQRDLAKLNVDFTRIAAPTSGRISRRLVDPGNLVRADETPLATIMSDDPIHVYFDIDERTVLRLRRLIQEGKIANPFAMESRSESPSQSESSSTPPAASAATPTLAVLVSLADEQEYVRTGAIDFEDNHIDPTTGTLRVRIMVENKDRLLSPGLFVRLRFPVGKPRSALLVPEEALASDQGRRFLYVVGAEDLVEQRPVEIGVLDAGQRVIEGGLTTGERVVVTGHQRIKKGKPVTPKPVEDLLQKVAPAGG